MAFTAPVSSSRLEALREQANYLWKQAPKLPRSSQRKILEVVIIADMPHVTEKGNNSGFQN